MRKLTTTITAATLALAGAGLAAHAATSVAAADAGSTSERAAGSSGSVFFNILPYIEQDNLPKQFDG
jgi:hypothetical protein